jgi:hypothetical protein
MNIETNEYYDEFLRYYQMAKTQQEECNLGVMPYLESSVDDDLMKNVHLYDVVNRKYAGFTQILHDLWHNNQESHPYKDKLHDIRKPITQKFAGVENTWGLDDWIYVFIVHRVTGSGINYAKNPSGYSNNILADFDSCYEIKDMIKVIKERAKTGPSFYTSVGYQFPAFPKPLGEYRTGGNMYLCEYANRLADDLASFLLAGEERKTLRQVGEFMFNWNKTNGLRVYRFQYAAVIADIADFFPQLVDPSSLFYYGTNAVECISYMVEKKSKLKGIDLLDAVVLRACEDTGGVPYDIEDVMCDTIRWIENYALPGGDYDHLDRDKIFSSCHIQNHPFGRQKRMLELGLINSFNNINVHPSDDYVLKMNKMSISEYKAIA